MASTVRKTVLKQTMKRGKSKDPTTDDLADQLASKLTIQGGSRKKQSPQSTDKAEEPESKSSSMRAVNAASQTLSGVVQSGWTKSTSAAANKITLQTATSSAASALRHLEILRRIVPDEVDVERAAMSVLGKLMVLEMFDVAAELLESTHARLIHLAKLPTLPNCPLISLPKPSTPPSDSTILTLLSTYLAYAPTILAQPHSIATISTLASYIKHSQQSCLVDWLPYFSTLPPKTLDSSLTRVYASLSKLCSSIPSASSSPSPEDCFVVRIYALKCLVSASPGTIAADTFWDQAKRFIGAYIKAASSSPSTSEAQQRIAAHILEEVDALIKIAERRGDRDVFMSPDSSSFVGFCDYWASFAKRAGDITLLKRIQGLALNTPSTLPELELPPSSSKPDEAVVDSRGYIREGSQYVTGFTQAADVLECQMKGDLDTSEVRQALQDSNRLLSAHDHLVKWITTLPCAPPANDDDIGRLRGKVMRSVEKLRRAVLHALEVSSTSREGDVRRVLMDLAILVVHVLGNILSSSTNTSESTSSITPKELLSQALDTVFTVSRTRLNTQDPQTYVTAFDELSIAGSILDTCYAQHQASSSSSAPPRTHEIDFPNLYRCLSGAFYNLGASVYQAGRIGSAVPFLKESCGVAKRALDMQEAGDVIKNERGKEMMQLREQLYKRWELLGLCFSKNGDRKSSYDAFVQAIVAFPFDALPGVHTSAATSTSPPAPPPSLAQLSRSIPPHTLFEEPDSVSSSSFSSIPPIPSCVRQLSSFMDRVTYMGACELLLSPDEVGLHKRLRAGSETQAWSADQTETIGLVLERQLHVLEESLWKEGVGSVYLGLVEELLLRVYTRSSSSTERGMPLRRAKVVLKALEFVYKYGEGGEKERRDVLRGLGFAGGSVEEMIREVEQLCTGKELGADAGLVRYAAQYRISALLWACAFAHRGLVVLGSLPMESPGADGGEINDQDEDQIPAERMVRAADTAYGLCKILLAQTPPSPAAPATATRTSTARPSPANAGLASRRGQIAVRSRTATTASAAGAGTTTTTKRVVTSRTAKVVASPPPSRALRSTRSAVPSGPPPAPRKVPARTGGVASRTASRSVSGTASAARMRGVGVGSTKGKGKAVASSVVVEEEEEADETTSMQMPATPRGGVRRRVSVRQSGAAVDGAPDGTTRIAFDYFEKFLALLQLTSRILGMSNLILPKAQVLDMTRKVAQRRCGKMDDAYISASLDLAYEYLTLGKRKRALSIFTQALEIVRSGRASDEVSVMFLLRYAQSLAYIDDVAKSSAVYLEALEIYQRLEKGKQKEGSTYQRIHARARLLETAGLAAHVYAMIQFSRRDLFASLDALLQSLRLFNRAAETLTRLSKPLSSTDNTESDPFQMNTLKDALPSTEPEKASQQPALPTTASANTTTHRRRPPSDGTEWRITEGLLNTLFSLSQAYLLRGNPREAEYFIQQALDLVTPVMPVMAFRALARRGEVLVMMGMAREACDVLKGAAEGLVKSRVGGYGVDLVDVKRLLGECEERLRDGEGEDEEAQAQGMLHQSLALLDTLNKSLGQFETGTLGPRKSLTNPSVSPWEVLAPELLAKILRKDLWLRKDQVDDEFAKILDALLSLSLSEHEQGEQHALVGKLTLHSICTQFKGNMVLSSLAESTIAVPMGMTSKSRTGMTAPSVDLLRSLEEAEEHLWQHLSLSAGKGDIITARSSILSLALLGAFQASLGQGGNDSANVTARLLDLSAALSLRLNMLDNIEQKLKGTKAFDDLQWPRISADGSPLLSSPAKGLSFSDDEDDDGLFVPKKADETTFWRRIHERYNAQVLDKKSLSHRRIEDLPPNWSIVSINISEDKNTLFISKQGSADPLIFCVPLNERREGVEEEEEKLSFDAAITELGEIVRLSDESTKAAIHVKPGDEEARVNWWKTRGDLDTRLRQLLENIEYCWLGGFKAILNPSPTGSAEILQEFQSSLERAFLRNLNVQETKKGSHKRAASQAHVQMASDVTLDENLVKCFSTLSPKCRDEELEDVVYFILDLYQYHGVQVAISEIDIDQVVIDLRTVLEEHNSRMARAKNQHARAGQTSTEQHPCDEHLFLILDRNVQGLPWESIPILRGRSVSRIPGVDFLDDRLALSKWKTELRGQHGFNAAEGAPIDPRKGFFILNPSGDLSRTEERFREWTKSMQKAGWTGTVGQPVSEQQFVDALNSNDLVIYFGHGGGEQYIRSHKIRTLSSCAATMLWGCSSGALRELGDFDRSGTPYNYMLAGCPTLVANLWDVTDKDIDKFSQSVFDHLGLNGKEVLKPRKTKTSIVAAVSQSRDTPKLKYLTGAAPVVYGIPFYL